MTARKVGVSTGWQPDGRSFAAIELAQEMGIGVELHRQGSERMLNDSLELVARAKVPVHSVHAIIHSYCQHPQNRTGEWLLAESGVRRRETVEAVVASARLTESIGADYLVLHLGDFPDGDIAAANRFGPVDPEADRTSRWVIECGARVIEAVLEKTTSCRVALENRGHICQAPLPHEMDALLRRFGATGRVGVCYDPAHARRLAVNHAIPRSTWQHVVGPFLLGVHVQDSLPSGEEHLALGEGDDTESLGWPNPNANWILEVGSANSEGVVRRALRTLLAL